MLLLSLSLEWRGCYKHFAPKVCPESSAMSGLWYTLNMWLLNSKPLFPSDPPSAYIVVTVIGTCQAQLQFSVLSYWLKKEIANHSKARSPSALWEALQPQRLGFKSRWTTAIANMLSSFIQLLLFSWEILTYHLRISLNVFTWVGSFTSPFPQPDKIDLPSLPSFCLVLISTKILSRLTSWLT